MNDRLFPKSNSDRPSPPTKSIAFFSTSNSDLLRVGYTEINLILTPAYEITKWRSP
ncbi:MAG: hypothetical protein ACKPCM_14595 [Pseudanabaena sp.]